MGKELELGDVVKLKSGGPKMTVNSDENSKTAECLWFVDDLGCEGPKSHTFKSCLLEPLEAKNV